MNIKEQAIGRINRNNSKPVTIIHLDGTTLDSAVKGLLAGKAKSFKKMERKVKAILARNSDPELEKHIIAAESR
jgi:hypothetical protein